MVVLGVSAALLGPPVDLVDEPAQREVGELPTPQVLHVHHRVAVLNPWPVAGDDVGYRRRVRQRLAQLVRIKGPGQLPGRVLGALQGAQDSSQQSGRGRIGADEAGRSTWNRTGYRPTA